MARTAYRLIYLIMLTVVLTHLLVYPAGWEEERLPVVMLTALHIREFTATAVRTGRPNCMTVPVGGPGLPTCCPTPSRCRGRNRPPLWP